MGAGWVRPAMCGWTRGGSLRSRLARGFGRQALEAPQVVPVVVERDPQVAVDGELSEFLVHAHATSLLFAQCAHEVDEAVSRACPLPASAPPPGAPHSPPVLSVGLPP